jgi:hypothetical protein
LSASSSCWTASLAPERRRGRRIATTNLEAALRTIIEDDPEVALYMAREVVEETMHIQAFLCVIRKVLAHYGLTLDQLRATNVSLKMSRYYVDLHTVLGWIRRDLNYYYFTRFALNVNQKTVERCTINEPGMHPASDS